MKFKKGDIIRKEAFGHENNYISWEIIDITTSRYTQTQLITKYKCKLVYDKGYTHDLGLVCQYPAAESFEKQYSIDKERQRSKNLKDILG